jgi:hypothetical protein
MDREKSGHTKRHWQSSKVNQCNFVLLRIVIPLIWPIFHLDPLNTCQMSQMSSTYEK